MNFIPSLYYLKKNFYVWPIDFHKCQSLLTNYNLTNTLTNALTINKAKTCKIGALIVRSSKFYTWTCNLKKHQGVVECAA